MDPPEAAEQKHNPTPPSQTSAEVAGVTLNTPQPGDKRVAKSAEELSKQYTRLLRKSLVLELMLAYLPDYNGSTSKDRRVMNLMDHIKRLEVKLFSKSDNHEEYQKLLSSRIKSVKMRRKRKINSMGPQQLFPQEIKNFLPPQQPVDQSQQQVQWIPLNRSYLRDETIDRLLSVVLLTQNFAHLLRNPNRKMLKLLAYLRTVEQEMFEKARNEKEYLKLRFANMYTIGMESGDKINRQEREQVAIEKNLVTNKTLRLLFSFQHAHNCGNDDSCDTPDCSETKEILSHMFSCREWRQCKQFDCNLSRSVLKHWTGCKVPTADCQICEMMNFMRTKPEVRVIEDLVKRLGDWDNPDGSELTASTSGGHSSQQNRKPSRYERRRNLVLNVQADYFPTFVSTSQE